MKAKSEDSKIYSFLKSRILDECHGSQEEEISDYFAQKALAKARIKAVALHNAIAQNVAAVAAIQRVKREIEIIDQFLPQPAKEDEIDMALIEAVFALEESGEPLLLDGIMRIMAQQFAGKYSAFQVKFKAERLLVSKL